MMGPSWADLAKYAPRAPGGVVELNLSDQWRAVWVYEQEFPPHAPVFYVYVLVFKGDKGYVTRRAGSNDTWQTVEGEAAEGESPEETASRLAREMTGANVVRSDLVGFLECRATSHNAEFPAGSVTVRPLFVSVADEIGDVPEESGWERRRLPLNEHGLTLRRRYPEMDQYIDLARQHYGVLLGRGEVPAR